MLSQNEYGFDIGENPRHMGVYLVQVNLHGELVPNNRSQPKLYAYYDGVDTWGSWEFSVPAAKRAEASGVGVIPWKPLGNSVQEN